MKIVLLGMLASFGFLPTSTSLLASQTMDVCQVLRNLPKLSGQLITVRGEVAFGSNYFLIRPYRCEIHSLLDLGKTPGLRIVYTRPGSIEELLRAHGGLGKLWREMQRVTTKGRRGVLIATLKGSLDASDPKGYGHMNSLAGEIKLIDAKDIRFIGVK